MKERYVKKISSLSIVMEKSVRMKRVINVNIKAEYKEDAIINCAVFNSANFSGIKNQYG